MYELKNFSEVMVKKALEEYLASNKIPCQCERCIADITAFALNRLPPRYYVSEKGEILTNYEAQLFPDRARVMTEVILATQIVAAAPSHDRN
ncbi:MAG: late competence development ComFB family protein [Peptococcaceae bacterium]|nr:late competence development ComFB family protein [Peptococcaceae bacterium]